MFAQCSFSIYLPNLSSNFEKKSVNRSKNLKKKVIIRHNMDLQTNLLKYIGLVDRLN